MERGSGCTGVPGCGTDSSGAGAARRRRPGPTVECSVVIRGQRRRAGRGHCCADSSARSRVPAPCHAATGGAGPRAPRRPGRRGAGQGVRRTGQAASCRIRGTRSGREPGPCGVREGLHPPVEPLGERQQQPRLLLLELQRLVRGPGVAHAAAGSGADGEDEGVPRRGAPGVLRQDVLVGQQRDGLGAVRADHPDHLEHVVRVGATVVVRIDRLRFGTFGELQALHGNSPSGGPQGATASTTASTSRRGSPVTARRPATDP